MEYGVSMKDEIKEILDNLKNKDISVDDLTHNDKVKLIDYITNLQEENDYLKDIVSNTELSNEIKKADKWSKRELYKINFHRLLINGRLREEIERLKNGYCELKVKCNNGECDCTNEEYDGMVQANMKGKLLLEDYKSRNKKAIEYIKSHKNDYEPYELNDYNIRELLDILQGSDKDGND